MTIDNPQTGIRRKAVCAVTLAVVSVGIFTSSLSLGQSSSDEKFQKFKQMLEGGYDVGALGFMNLSAPDDSARMKRYAEAQCAKKDQTACSVAYCGAGGGEEFFTIKCAEVTGRAYGDGWVEFRRRSSSKNNSQIISVVCTKTGGGPSIECYSMNGSCRHNFVKIADDPVRHLSGFFPTLDSAARDACSGRVVRAK